MDLLRLALGLLVIGLAVAAVIRRVDVRLALIVASVVLGLLAGDLGALVQKFLATFADERYVVPICSAMGFAYVLQHTGCDRHLVQLLVNPLRRVRPLLIPGAVLVGFLVNIPILSQTSTAASIGAVLIPLLFAARISPITAGAALLLGASLGGELLNPSAPEYATVTRHVEGVSRAVLVGNTLPLVLLQLFVATALFWLLSARAEQKIGATEPAEAGSEAAPFRVSLLKAAVPLVPLVLLFLTSRAFDILPLPQGWLVGAGELADLKEAAAQRRGADLFESRLIAAAMLVGVVAAALVSLPTREGRVAARDTARAFFAGAGYAFAEIIAIIVAATCFAEGVKRIGVGALIGGFASATPGLLLPAAGFFPLLFAAICGSGFAATQGLFEFFVAPALAQGIDPAYVGSVVSLGAAAGRTMSPVAAVTLMCAKLTNTSPADLVRRVALPLLAGMIAAVLLAAAIAPR